MSPKISWTSPKTEDGEPHRSQASRTKFNVDDVDNEESADGAPSQQKIVKQYLGRRGRGQFNFEERVLANHITGDSARALIPESKVGQWVEPAYSVTRENVLSAATKVMPAYWEQANRSNQLATLKAQQELAAYAFLSGDEDFADELRDMEPAHCGKHVLVAWCTRHELKWEQWDNGDWVSDADGVPVEAKEALGDAEEVED